MESAETPEEQDVHTDETSKGETLTSSDQTKQSPAPPTSPEMESAETPEGQEAHTDETGGGEVATSPDPTQQSPAPPASPEMESAETPEGQEAQTDGTGEGEVSTSPDQQQSPAPPTSSEEDVSPSKMRRVLDIELPVTVSFGSTQRSLGDILQLAPGVRIELNNGADEPVILTVNNKVFARGELVVVDGHYGVRIKQIETTAERIASLGE